MCKPFILDVSSPTYEKQFENCKLNQNLSAGQNQSCDYMQVPSHNSDPHISSSDVLHAQPTSLPVSLQYQPYPKPATNSFCDMHDTPLSVSGVTTRDIAPLYAQRKPLADLSTQLSCHGTRINSRLLTASTSASSSMSTICIMDLSEFHGMHSCSLCGNFHHCMWNCTQN